jgi:hypothetical protein
MTPALRDQIKTAVLLQQQQKLSDSDPLFTYLISNVAVLESFSKPIFDAIEALPGALGESVFALAKSVEECENAASDLIKQTQGELRGIARVEVDSAHIAVKEAVKASVDQLLIQSLGTVRNELAEVERRAKAIGGGWGSARSQVITFCLAVSLAAVVAVSTVVGFALKHSAEEQKKAAAYWHEQATQKAH